tara:strand:- start:525 stop:1076 length:552 start_codon:yes stop_codon:yes gene_type:complete
MKKKKTSIKDLFIIEENKIFQDDRGLFFESWNLNKFKSLSLFETFKQDNISISKKNVLRGLHLQLKPFSQLKLVQVLQGQVLDVIVDLRKKSDTFGKHEKIYLNSNDRKILWVPEGCAHGFLSLENNSVFSYKCNKNYNKNSEITINWNDPDLNINWEIEKPLLSEKDKKGISFYEYLKLTEK